MVWVDRTMARPFYSVDVRQGLCNLQAPAYGSLEVIAGPVEEAVFEVGLPHRGQGNPRPGITGSMEVRGRGPAAHPHLGIRMDIGLRVRATRGYG